MNIIPTPFAGYVLGQGALEQRYGEYADRYVKNVEIRH